MGNEMGNNNTSSIKEEDAISDAEKKTIQEDTNELANGMSQEIHANIVKEENQNTATSIAKDVTENSSKASNDITNELGKDTLEEDGHAEDVKGKTQTITTAEAKDEDTQEKAIGIASNNTTSMLENDSMEGDTHSSDVNMENQMLPTARTEGVQEKATGLVSEDATIELGKVTLQEDSHEDYVKEKTQMIPTDEAKDVQEEATGLSSNNAASMLENDLLGEDTRKSDMNEENKMHPPAEIEELQEKATIMASDYTRSSLENDLLKGDALEDDVNVDHQKHQTVEGKDDQIEARLDFNDKTSEIEDKPEGDKQDGSVVNSIANDIDVEGQTTFSPSDDPLNLANSFEGAGEEITEVRQPEKFPNAGSVEAEGGNSESLSSSSLEGTKEYENQEESCLREHLLVTYNHPLYNEPSIQQGDAHEDDVNVDHQKHQTVEGKDDQITARLDFDDKTSEFEDKPQEDRQDGNEVNPIANGIDVEGKTTILGPDDPLILTNSLEGAGEEITEVRQPEKSPNAGSVEAEGGNSESLSSSSLEVADKYEKQEESCLREHLLLTHNQELNNEPSSQQAVEEETTVLALNAVNMSIDREIQESSSVHSDHDEPVKYLSEQSFLGTELLPEENLLDPNSLFQQIKDDGLEKQLESHEKLCTNKSDGKGENEFGSSLIDTSGTTSDSPSMDNTTNGNSLTKVNYTTEDTLTSLPESFIVDNPLKLDHEKDCKVLYEENVLSISGSTMENSHDYEPDQCMKDSLKEYNSGMMYTCDMEIGSNGDCNGERNMLVDANVNNSNKTSEESGAASEQKQKHSVVPEAKTISLIAGLTVVDCIHAEGENYKKEIKETNEKQEASHVMVNTSEGAEMLEECNSDVVTINQEESFPLQNCSSLLHVYDYHQDSVKQTNSFTATSMLNSDWNQTNESKNFGPDNLDSSKLTLPSVDLVDDEAFEKEGEEHSQHAEAASSAVAKVTTSTTTRSIEQCSNNTIFANGGYETRDSVTRLSTESNPDHANISSHMQKSPSFNLNLRKEASPEESDQTPLLHKDNSSNERLSKQTNINLIKSTSHDEYEQCMLHSEDVPVEEKIVTMERSYSEKSKVPFIGLLKQEEEAHLLEMPQIQDNHVGTKNAGSSTSPKRKEKRKARSSFFSSCMCCATVP